VFTTLHYINLHLLTYLLLPSLPFPLLLPGVKPLNQAREYGECCNLPQWVWAEASHQTACGAFELKRMLLVIAFLTAPRFYDVHFHKINNFSGNFYEGSIRCGPSQYNFCEGLDPWTIAGSTPMTSVNGEFDVVVVGSSKLRQGDKFTSSIYKGSTSEPLHTAGPPRL